MADIQALAKKASERLAVSSNKSNLRFYEVSKQVVIGSGITNKNDVARIARQVGDELRRHSANARKARAADKKSAVA